MLKWLRYWFQLAKLSLSNQQLLLYFMAWQHGGIAYRGKEIWSAGKYFQSNKDITAIFLQNNLTICFPKTYSLHRTELYLTVDSRGIGLWVWCTGDIQSSQKWRCVRGWLVPSVPRRKLITIFFKREQYKRYVATGIRDHHFFSKRRTAIIHWSGATSKKYGDLKVRVAQLTKMTKKETEKTIKHRNEHESVTAQQLLYVQPTSDIQVPIFLSTFAKLREATIRFIIY